VKRVVAAVAVALAVSACSTDSTSRDATRPLVVASSSIAANFVQQLAGDTVDLVVLVPNRIDTHTYEPAPSELRALERADLVVMPDRDLNPSITQVVGLAVASERVLDLNEAALGPDAYVYRNPSTRTGRNVHTWTDPMLAAMWVVPLTERLSVLVPGSAAVFEQRAAELTEELSELDTDTAAVLRSLPDPNRKLVVYHDAWEYFGRRYGLDVVGALQAVNFTEPSAAEVAAMADQIKAENVPAFFGSEVFPSDVMVALERESGARYVEGLADDALPGSPGGSDHTYTAMMRGNVELIRSALGEST
jgi:ABC-type Zn uptake system ZnuABC Zn-binding protein ZnuA